MIDLSTETPITLAHAARTLPGGPVHVSTMHRWRLRGIKGIVLETFKRGGVRMTTYRAIERFFEAITAADNGEPVPTRTPNQRERDVTRAEKETAAAGI